MWRWLLVSFALAATASAAPHGHVASRAPAFAAAEKLWSAAHDPASWRAAGDAFFAIAERPASDADKLAAARSGWAALHNANPTDTATTVDQRPFGGKLSPHPLSDADARFVHDAELYERLDRGSPDAVAAEFIRANMLRRYDQLEPANALYLDIVATHPEHEVAEHAAELVLDTFDRLEQYDQLVAFADRLRADKPFVAHRPELAQWLRQIHLRSLRLHSPRLEGSHEQPRFAEYADLAERYLDAVEPGERGDDELLYNAMAAFSEAHAYNRALEIGQRLLAGYRTSKLMPRTIARIAATEAAIGRYADAARDLERYAVLAPGEHDVGDALGDALLYRVGLGDLDRAGHDLDAFARAPDVDAVELARSTGGLAKAELDAGQRPGALRHARAIRPRAAAPIALGLVLAELACPVALVDELCPRARDPVLLAQARNVLERATDADDLDDTGRRVLVDLAVETGTVRTLVDATLRYRELTGDRSDTRVIAHERLGRLAVLAHHTGEAAGEFALCITEARDHTLALPWLQRCERERAALGKPPVVSPLGEHLPAELSGSVTALEHI